MHTKQTPSSASAADPPRKNKLSSSPPKATPFPPPSPPNLERAVAVLPRQRVPLPLQLLPAHFELRELLLVPLPGAVKVAGRGASRHVPGLADQKPVQRHRLDLHVYVRDGILIGRVRMGWDGTRVLEGPDGMGGIQWNGEGLHGMSGMMGWNGMDGMEWDGSLGWKGRGWDTMEWKWMG